MTMVANGGDRRQGPLRLMKLRSYYSFSHWFFYSISPSYYITIKITSSKSQWKIDRGWMILAFDLSKFLNYFSNVLNFKKKCMECFKKMMRYMNPNQHLQNTPMLQNPNQFLYKHSNVASQNKQDNNYSRY